MFGPRPGSALTLHNRTWESGNKAGLGAGRRRSREKVGDTTADTPDYFVRLSGRRGFSCFTPIRHWPAICILQSEYLIPARAMRLFSHVSS